MIRLHGCLLGIGRSVILMFMGPFISFLASSLPNHYTQLFTLTRFNSAFPRSRFILGINTFLSIHGILGINEIIRCKIELFTGLMIVSDNFYRIFI